LINQKKINFKYFKFNDKKEGEYKEYYINGKLEEICNYKNGWREGEYKNYYENG
jgi:antitoxin component YwqK of YwqJK toxin-antitoxin module